MRLALFLILLSNQVLAQPLTGVWTGKFSREHKSVLMQVDILEDRHETYGFVLLFSSDSSQLLSKYVVKLIDSGHQKFLFRKINTDFEKSPTGAYPKQVVLENSRRGFRATSSNEPSLSRLVVQQDVVTFTAEKTLNFQQLIGILTDSSNTIFSGNWYVEEVGINSYERPAGKFFLEKSKEPLSPEREMQLRNFIKQ